MPSAEWNRRKVGMSRSPIATPAGGTSVTSALRLPPPSTSTTTIETGRSGVGASRSSVTLTTVQPTSRSEYGSPASVAPQLGHTLPGGVSTAPQALHFEATSAYFHSA